MKFLLTILCCFTVFPAFGALTAYDGFAYGTSDNSNFASMSAEGGFGWQTNSIWKNSSDQNITNTLYKSHGLTYMSPDGTDLITTGGCIYIENCTNAPAEIGRDINASVSLLPASGSNSIWLSFLYQHNDTNIGQAYFSLIPDSDNPGVWNYGVFYGHHWTEERLVNRPRGFTDSTLSSELLTPGKIYLLLARLTFTGQSNSIATNCISTMWVYESGIDSLPVTEPSTSSGWTQGGSKGVECDLTDVWILQNGASQGAHSFDELRIGDSWQDVIPVHGNQGPIYAYEGFDYPPTNDISAITATGGVGFATAWMTPSSAEKPTEILPYGLSFIDGFGIELDVTGHAIAQQASTNIQAIVRRLARTIGISGPMTTWVSFLCHDLGSTNDLNGPNLCMLSINDNPSTFAPTIGAGKKWNAKQFVSRPYAFGSSTADIGSGDYTTNTYFMLGRIALGSSNALTREITVCDVSWWRYEEGYDELPYEEPFGGTTLHLTGSVARTFPYVAFHHGLFDDEAAPFAFDELRIGPEWDDVVVVIPEPIGIGFFIIAGVCLLRRSFTA